MSERYGISDEQIARMREVEAELQAAQQDISTTFLANYGLKKGEVVEDTTTGLHYRLEWCNVHFPRLGRGDQPSVSMSGYRLWKSGRKAGREAHSLSFLSGSNVKKVEA